MSSYSFWNNKGGVGKSFLCFSVASEYAFANPNTDVYVIDICPQANVSDTFLGGYEGKPNAIRPLLAAKPRRTIAGYLEARLNSPFRMVDDVSSFITIPSTINNQVPANLRLVAGDNLLELLSEAIRQTSQLAIPRDSWKQVIGWVRDLVVALRTKSDARPAYFFIDCNPSFAIYTQLALAASDFVIVPFTADDSSRRAMENVVSLLYGIGMLDTDAYASIDFSKRAKEMGVSTPRLHTFVSNRQTFYKGEPSKAFNAVSKSIKETVDGVFQTHKAIFANPLAKPSSYFIETPDNHGAAVVSALMGTPVHHMTPGPKIVNGIRVQINKDPLDKYKKALTAIVNSI